MNNLQHMNWLQMDLSAALLIAVVMIIRVFFRNKLPRQTFIWLWGMIWLRLCIPLSLPSPFQHLALPSWMTWSGRSGTTGTSSAVHSTAAGRESASVSSHLSGSTSVITGTSSTEHASSSFNGWMGGFHARPAAPVDLIAVWHVIWIAGAIACGAFLILAYMRWYHRFAQAEIVDHPFVNHWLCRHTLRRRIQVRQSADIVSPLTYGIFKPIIIMPITTDWNDQDRLDYVLTHEYVHIRRMDSLIKMLMLLALCLHWYNPLVWMMCALVNRDLELSCDETVVRLVGHEHRADYARTLIYMEEQKVMLPSTANYFSKLAIEERIESIMNMKKMTAAAVLSASLLVGGTAAIVATSPANAAVTTPAVAKSTTPAATASHTLQVGDTWKVNNEWEFTVNSVKTTTLRGKKEDGYTDAKQAVIVNYSYKNIRPAGGEELAFSKANFDLTDANDANNLVDGAHNGISPAGSDKAVGVAPGKSIEGATWAYAFYDKAAKTVKFNVAGYDAKLNLHETTFVVPVEDGTAKSGK
ncbi:M56 family metallopeptidase [Paenibacillus sp. WLX2291]|uniref:M56 family metallopeptidase n=1 Tax=Paenibacillus sp. WLX2291 TaxID=3296934 RepID=UPI0039842517